VKEVSVALFDYRRSEDQKNRREVEIRVVAKLLESSRQNSTSQSEHALDFEPPTPFKITSTSSPL